MSENIRNREERKGQLKEIIKNLHDDGDIPAMKKRFREILHELSPEELAEAEQALIAEGVPVEEVQKLCEVHVAAFEDALKQSSRSDKTPAPIPGHPIDTYRKENRELKKLLRRFRRSLSDPETAKKALVSLSEVEKHYARKENQLFPFLEEVGFTGPSKVMWAKHDEIRDLLKTVAGDISRADREDLKRNGRRLIPSMKRMIFMEEKILFPTALRKLPDSTWKKIRRGEGEIGYSWIKPASLWDPDVIPDEFPGEVSVVPSPGPNDTAEGIDLSVGRLLPSQVDLMLKNLPFDVTYVDENDRVRYYSQGKERIFPRSPGIIGRDVQNCHPPKSVHVVQKIVDDFKNRKRSEAEFWIQMGGKFIHIRYFPLFEGEVYRGVLEVSQDLTPLRALEGEKRLLDDENMEADA